MFLKMMNLQPHSEACRKKMAIAMEGDAGVAHSKRRRQEREGNTQEVDSKGQKRSMLEDIEDEINAEPDLEKLDGLHKKYAEMAQSGTSRRVRTEDVRQREISRRDTQSHQVCHRGPEDE